MWRSFPINKEHVKTDEIFNMYPNNRNNTHVCSIETCKHHKKYHRILNLKSLIRKDHIINTRNTYCMKRCPTVEDPDAILHVIKLFCKVKLNFSKET